MKKTWRVYENKILCYSKNGVASQATQTQEASIQQDKLSNKWVIFYAIKPPSIPETKDKWFGVTYKEDKEAVVQSFKKLIEDGVYREELYSDLWEYELSAWFLPTPAIY